VPDRSQPMLPQGVVLAQLLSDWQDLPADWVDTEVNVWRFTAICTSRTSAQGIAFHGIEKPDSWSRTGVLPSNLSSADARDAVEEQLQDEFGELDFVWTEQTPGRWYAVVGEADGQDSLVRQRPVQPRPTTS
jgi:hypothetical protein